MKKIFRSAMLVVVAAAAFISCNKQEPIDVPTPEAPGAFRVKFGVESNITKAVTTDNDVDFVSLWIDGDEVAISTYQSGASIDSKVQATWINDGFYADFDGAKYDAGQTYQLKGIYPYSENGSVDFGNTRNQVYTAQNGLYDIMVSSQISSTLPTAEALVLPMARQTATVYFHLKSAFDEVVKSVTLVTDEGKPIAAVSATLDTENGFVPTTGSDCNFITLKIKEDESNVMRTTDMQFWFNVLPVEGTSLKLIVESETKTFTMNKKANTTSWQAGYLYTTVLEGIPAEKWVEKPAPSSTITINKDNSSTPVSYGNGSFTLDGVAFSYNQWMVSQTYTGCIQIKAGTVSALSNTTAMPGRISAITVTTTGNNYVPTIKAGTTASPSNAISGSFSNRVTTFDFGENNYTYFSLSAPSNAIYISSIVIEYDSSYDPLNPNFSIKVPDEEITHGTVSLKNSDDQSITYAKAGELVKLTAVPNEGYDLTEGTLVAKNSVTSEVIPFEAGTTNFTMPAANVVVEASFYKLPYHVTYNKNTSDETFAGTIPTDSKDYTDDDSEVTVADGSELTRQDYLFKEWNTVANPTNENPGFAYKSGDKFDISSNTTLYAQWEEKTYVVTLIAPEEGTGTYEVKVDGVAISSGDQFVNGTVLTYVEHPAPGYRFYNWQAVDESTHTYSSATSRTYTIDRHDVTIKGKFEVHPQHDVRFFVNGSQYGETLVINEDELISFPEAPEDIYGFKFQGWYTTAGPYESAPDYVDPAKAVMGEENIDYYAVFAIEVSAEFDPNDITKTPEVSTNTWKDIKTNIQLKLSAGQRYTSGTPKTFTVTKSSSGSKNYFQVSHASLNLTKVVTTISESKYKIVSVSDGASLSNSSDGLTQTVTASSLKSINCNATTSEQIRATRITVYSQSGFCSTVQPRTETCLSWSDDTVTAYLNSTTNTFPTLTSSPAGLTGIVYTSSNASVATINATTGDITIKGTGTATITASFSGDATYAPAADASYTLTVSEYTTAVTLERNGATSGDTQVTAKLGFAMPSITKPSKTGHTFQGYYIDSDFTGKQYYNASGASAYNWDIQEATATLYAKWTANNYTVTFNKNNSSATGSMSNQSITYGQSANLTANAFTLTGYTFQGWATAATGSVVYSDRAEYTMESASNVTLYAVWNPNTYTITLDANGNGSNGSMSIVYNATSATSISHVSTSTEENFKGYYTAAENGNKVVNADGTLVKNVSGWTSSDGKWIKAENATLYAQVGSVHNDPVTITYADVTATSYSATETIFTKNEITYGYNNVMRNNQNGTPSGWAKEQVIQCKASSTFYNKDGISMSKVRVYLAANTNTFTVSYGSTTACDGGSVARPTTSTGTESVSYTTYSNKKTGSGTATLNYYDFDLNGATYFKITAGSSTVYIYKIVITY